MNPSALASQTWLLVGMGLPGSGKSSFLKAIAQEFSFVYWYNDEARLKLFSNPTHDSSEHKLLANIAKLVISQSLTAQKNIIWDVNANKYHYRREFMRITKQHGARLGIVWLEVDEKEAEARINQRATQATGRLKKYYSEFRPDLVAFMQNSLEPPQSHEPIIIIKGNKAYALQRKSFLQQLNKLK